MEKQINVRIDSENEKEFVEELDQKGIRYSRKESSESNSLSSIILFSVVALPYLTLIIWKWIDERGKRSVSVQKGNKIVSTKGLSVDETIKLIEVGDTINLREFHTHTDIQINNNGNSNIINVGDDNLIHNNL